jgi:hypothetical protein
MILYHLLNKLNSNLKIIQSSCGINVNITQASGCICTEYVKLLKLSFLQGGEISKYTVVLINYTTTDSCIMLLGSWREM